MRVKVFPVEGRLVRHPKTGRLISAEGDVIVESSYWTRLVRDGDVTIEPITSAPTSASSSEDSEG